MFCALPTTLPRPVHLAPVPMPLTALMLRVLIFPKHLASSHPSHSPSVAPEGAGKGMNLEVQILLNAKEQSLPLY